MKLAMGVVVTAMLFGCNKEGPDAKTKARLAGLEAQVQELQQRLDEQAQAMSQYQTTVTGLRADLRAQAEKVTRRDVLDAFADFVSVDGSDIIVEGANLHVRNAEGASESQDGTGNLIIGYNEAPDGQEVDRSGSHNVVIGPHNQFSSYCGQVGGRENKIAAPYASVVSGTRNAATANRAVVVSGTGNTAAGGASVVVAGQDNATVGDLSVVAAGDSNTVNGNRSAVLGGYDQILEQDVGVVVGDASGVSGD